jgi:hypothetical protein
MHRLYTFIYYLLVWKKLKRNKKINQTTTTRALVRARGPKRFYFRYKDMHSCVAGKVKTKKKIVRDESGVDHFRIRSYPNLNYADMEMSF